jgi:hypothetical protein
VEFSAVILLNIFPLPFAYTSLRPMIGRFSLLMELQSACLFFSQLFSLFSKCSSVFFSLISVLYSSLKFCLPLLQVHWCGFQLIFFDLRKFFVPGFLFDPFFLSLFISWLRFSFIYSTFFTSFTYIL